MTGKVEWVNGVDAYSIEDIIIIGVDAYDIENIIIVIIIYV